APAGADRELADARPIPLAGRVLRGESFVHVVVAVDDPGCPGGMEHLPERGDLLDVAVLARAEARVVPDRPDAGRRVAREIRPQPGHLLGVAVALDLVTVRVEDVDPPGPEAEGVPALAA